VAEAFAPLFGSTHARYGLIDFFRWQNMQEVSATVGIKPHKMVDFSVAYYAFWLATTKDAWVNSGGNVIRRASDPDNTSSFVGHEFDAVLGFSPFKQLKFEMVYCLFVPQDFAQQAAKAGEKSDKAQGFWFNAQLML